MEDKVLKHCSSCNFKNRRVKFGIHFTSFRKCRGLGFPPPAHKFSTFDSFLPPHIIFCHLPFPSYRCLAIELAATSPIADFLNRKPTFVAANHVPTLHYHQSNPSASTKYKIINQNGKDDQASGQAVCLHQSNVQQGWKTRSTRTHSRQGQSMQGL